MDYEISKEEMIIGFKEVPNGKMELLTVKHPREKTFVTAFDNQLGRFAMRIVKLRIVI